MGGGKVNIHSADFSKLSIAERGQFIKQAILGYQKADEIFNFHRKYTDHLLMTSYTQYPTAFILLTALASKRASQDISFVLKSFDEDIQRKWAKNMPDGFLSVLNRTVNFNDLISESGNLCQPI